MNLHQKMNLGQKELEEKITTLCRDALAQGDIYFLKEQVNILRSLEKRTSVTEELRVFIWEYFWSLFLKVGRDGQIDDQVTLCECVIQLAPSPESNLVTEATRSILYLLFDTDPARAQPYYQYFFRNQKNVPDRIHDWPLECHASDGPDIAGNILAAHGVVLVRDLAPLARCDMIRQEFEMKLNEEKERPPYRLFDEIENAAYLVKGKAGIFLERMLRPFLARPTLASPLSYIRRVDASVPGSRTPFHQDIQAFCAEVVNAWTPLMTCGTTLPGLQFVAKRMTGPLPTARTPGEYNYIEIPPETIKDKYGEAPLYNPTISLGDMAIFLGSTVHRTYITPAMIGHRISVEARFVST